MNSKIRYIPLVVIGAILLSLMAIGPAFSEDTGTVLIISEDQADESGNSATDPEDELEWTRMGGTTVGQTSIVIEVVDDDLNTSVDQVHSEAIVAGQSGPVTVALSEYPLAGDDKDSAGLSIDKDASTTNAKDTALIVGVANAELGLINLFVPSSPAATAGNLVINYESAEVDTAMVTVDSGGSGNATELEVVLEETSGDPTSGVFRGTLQLISSSIADNQVQEGQLRVSPDDEVTVSYADADPKATRRASVDVETTSPTIDGHSPDDGVVEKSAKPDLVADITDTESGINDEDPLDIKLVVVRTSDGDLDAGRDGDTVFILDVVEADTEEIEEGLRATTEITNAFGTLEDDEDLTFYWWYLGGDIAGNVGVTDEDPNSVTSCDPDVFNAAVNTQLENAADAMSLESLVAQSVQHMKNNVAQVDEDGEPVYSRLGDGSEYAGCQGFSYLVDQTPPELISTDAVRTGATWDSEEDEPNTNPREADSTSVMLTFTEKLEADTVQAEDFTVGDETPSAVDVQGKYVFLTVSTLDPDDTPELTIVKDSGITDLAGRTLRSATIEEDDVEDGIAPSLEVSITGVASNDTRPGSDESVTVLVVANEKVTQPTYTWWRVNDVATSTYSDPESGPIPFDSARTYEVEISLDDPGLYSVLVSARDGGNTDSEGRAGVNHGADDAKAFEDVSGALTFEVDTEVAGGEDGLVLDPDSEADDEDRNEFTTDDPNAFISIDLSAEADEYEGDSYGAVTVISAMLGDDDITDMLIPNTANNSFLYKASGLAVGEYDVEIKASDAVGNEEDFEGTVTVTERKPYSLSLRPGWNLVSIPGDPANTDINSVIPADHPASRVHSYDPMVPGLWLTAIRGADGSFSGTLTDITAGRAYLIETDSSAPVSIDIPRTDATSVPPVIVLSEGWNMIPVLDPAGEADDDDQRSVVDYLGSSLDDVSRIYGYNSISGALIEVETDEMLNVGEGYWVYVTDEGAITP